MLAPATLYQHWKGYAPPGSCILVPLASSVCENNAHGCASTALCPTMRIPEDSRLESRNRIQLRLVTADYFGAT